LSAFIFWVADSLIDTLFFSHAPYLESLMPTGMELYMRLLVSLQIIAFGYLASRYVIKRDVLNRIFAELLNEDRKKAVNALVESEEKYRRLFELSADPMWLIVKDRFVIANHAAALSLGYATTEALINTHPSELSPERQSDGRSSYDKANEMMAQAYREGYLRFEWVHKKINGDEFFVEVSLTRIPYDGNVALFCVWRDITERKQSEAALRKSNELLDSLLNSMAEGAYGVDTSGNCTFVNNSFLNFLGYESADEIIGKPIHKLIHHSYPDGSPYPPVKCQMYAAYQRNQKVHVSDEVFWRKNGSAMPVEYWSQPISRDGVVVGAIATFLDITERKQAEKILRESEEKFRNIMESSLVSIYVIQDGVFKYVNQTLLEKSGYSMEDLQNGRHPLDLIAPEHREVVARNLQERLAGVPGYPYEIRILRKDGTYLDVVAWGAVIQYQGRPANVGTLVDITERKRAEVALAMQYQRIEEMNTQLIAANQQLQQAQDQLLQSEKMAAIGQLAAGIAHEINNPIGYVDSNTGTLKKYLADIFSVIDKYEAVLMAADESSPQLQELRQLKQNVDIGFIREDASSLINESRQGLERVKKIVLDLKNFARHEITEEWVLADLHRGMDATLNVVWNELKYKCEVVKEYGTLPEIYCRPSQLDQVFMNLLVNAAHAIESHGTITIRTGQEGERVWFEVSDTGVGIPPENIPRVFDPFFTTKPVGIGTGLGLSVSFSIVAKHHGEIEVHSEVGKGTTFRVWLPIQQPETRNQGTTLAA